MAGDSLSVTSRPLDRGEPSLLRLDQFDVATGLGLGWGDAFGANRFGFECSIGNLDLGGEKGADAIDIVVVATSSSLLGGGGRRSAATAGDGTMRLAWRGR